MWARGQEDHPGERGSRAPRMRRRLTHDSSPGLQALIQDQVDEAASMRTHVHPALTVLPAGATHRDPARSRPLPVWRSRNRPTDQPSHLSGHCSSNSDGMFGSLDADANPKTSGARSSQRLDPPGLEDAVVTIRDDAESLVGQKLSWEPCCMRRHK